MNTTQKKSPQHRARAIINFVFSNYDTFSFVMLFAQMPIVETLCKNADVVGESRPKNPPTSKLVLNVMIKR